jgi:hypothetical protein
MLRRLAKGLKRLFARAARFRLSSLLLLMTIGAILLAWRRDHLRLKSEIARLQIVDARWGADEATGPPNTFSYGDITTAWASRTPDGQREWLLLEFDNVTPAAVHIYETYNPGALSRIARINVFGQEQVLWEGKDPTPQSAGGGVSKIRLQGVPATSRLKVYFDSPAVPGWNEIDAVALIDANGTPHWARRAKASTSYGPQGSLDVLW